jgi:hypothetical protein
VVNDANWLEPNDSAAPSTACQSEPKPPSTVPGAARDESFSTCWKAPSPDGLKAAGERDPALIDSVVVSDLFRAVAAAVSNAIWLANGPTASPRREPLCHRLHQASRPPNSHRVTMAPQADI